MSEILYILEFPHKTACSQRQRERERERGLVVGSVLSQASQAE